MTKIRHNFVTETSFIITKFFVMEYENYFRHNFLTDFHKKSVTKFCDDEYCDDANSVTNPSLNMICDGIVTEIFVTILVFSCSE